MNKNILLMIFIMSLLVSCNKDKVIIDSINEYSLEKKQKDIILGILSIFLKMLQRMQKVLVLVLVIKKQQY